MEQLVCRKGVLAVSSFWEVLFRNQTQHELVDFFFGLFLGQYLGKLFLLCFYE